ncbi:MAG: epimerase [Pseudomonadota bacterium]
MTARAKTLAVLGYGDLGARVVAKLRPESWRCVGFRRNPDKILPPATGVAVDLADRSSLLPLRELRPDALLVTLTPSARSEEGYRQGFALAMDSILAGLGDHRPACSIFVSSTRVYAEQGGGWVDEDSPLSSEPQAQAIIAAERQLLEYSENSIILRAGGLYSEAPGFLLRRVADQRFTAKIPQRYGNRIHRNDVARYIAGCFEARPATRILNLVDDSPVPIQEVEAWLAAQLGVPYEPPKADGQEVVSHKRISNARLRETGFELSYPDYRSGYAQALRQAQPNPDSSFPAKD